MISVRSQLAPALVLAGLLAGFGAAAQTLDALAGVWEPAPQASGPGARTRAAAAGELAQGWLRLTTRDLAPAGGELAETLMLTQSADGAVSAFLFRPGAAEPLRLAGGWSEPGRLKLSGEEGEEVWIWGGESACEAVLTRRSPSPQAAGRAPASRLRREGCEAPRTAAAPPPAPRPEAPPAEETASDAAIVELPSAVPAAAAAPAKAAEPRTVLIAGQGKPYEEVAKTVERLRQFLGARGVEVAGPSDDIVVLQAADSSLAYLVREVRERGAASLLWVTAAFGGREQIVVECYDANGNRLWSERTLGGTAWRKFEQMNPQLLARIQTKLEARIGGAGLPAAEPGAPSP